MIRVTGADPAAAERLCRLMKENLLPPPCFVAGEADTQLTIGQLCFRIVLGLPVGMQALTDWLSSIGNPGIPLRRAAALHQNLQLWLTLFPCDAANANHVSVGSSLIVLCPDENGCAAADLPDGIWTEIASGETFSGTYRRVPPAGQIPVLAAENTLLPVVPEEFAGNPEYLTLHWYEPKASAELAGQYAADMDGHILPKGAHLIVHHGGEEQLIR